MDPDASQMASPDPEPLPASTGTSHLSYVTAFQSQALSAASFNPTSTLSRDLADIFTTLLQQNIPGPTLVRLRTEFNRVLGRGRQFEVLGASPEFESFCNHTSVEPESAKLLQDQHCYAIKYALPPNASVSQNSSTNSSFRDAGSRSFAAQLHSAKVEIQKLCLPSLRGHANIVKLLRWGICLDTLEDPTAQIPRIPLLILERATTDLQRFMGQSVPERLPFDTLSQICLGVGHGLGALHAEGIYHGDLKLENVLMFQQRSGWVAKLCDFGLSGTVDHGTLEYRGTDGWRPPESFDGSKLQSAMVIKCDIFVYGLLVWSVFTGKCDSPLRRLDLHGNADPEKFILAATEELVRNQCGSNQETTTKLQEQQNVRVQRIFEDSLILAPECRSKSPWRYLDNPNNRVSTRGFEAGNTMHILDNKFPRSLLNSYPFVLCRMVARVLHLGDVNLPVVRREDLSEFDQKFSQEAASLSGSDGNRIRPHRGGLVAAVGRVFKVFPTRTVYHQKCVDTFNLYSKFWNIDGEGDSILPLRHPAEGHLDLGRFRGRLTELVLWSSMQQDRWQLQSSIPGFRPMSGDIESLVAELYALARIRSRCCQCCWDDSLLEPRKWHSISLLKPIFSNPGNLSFERHSIHPMFRFRDPHILPWLLRGEIGRNELSLLRDEPETLWNFTYSTALSASNRVALMVLLLENGCHIEDTFATTGGEPMTAFRRFLESLPTSGIKDATCAEELCRHFKRIAANSSTPSNTRAFLTGASHLLIDDGNIGENDVATTALHDAVVANRYLAVECLVRSGFVVDALDHRGLNTFALASSFHNRLRLPAEKRENDRIVVFLQQGMGMRQVTRPNGVRDLPRGWEAVGMDVLSNVYDESRMTSHSSGDSKPKSDIEKQLPESKPSTDNLDDQKSKPTTRQIHDDQKLFYQERHTDSITLKRPKVSIIEDRRLSLGFQAIAGARQVVGSENQVYGLDLIPFFNRNDLRNIDDHVASMPHQEVSTIQGALSGPTFQLSSEPMYSDDWYSTDVLRLQSMVVEPSIAGLFHVCLSPIRKFARIFPSFSSLFPARFKVFQSALATESLLIFASVAKAWHTFIHRLEYLGSRFNKSFMKPVSYGFSILFFRLFKRLYPFPDFAVLFRMSLQRVANSFWQLSVPVLVLFIDILLWLLFWVYFCLYLVGVTLAPLQTRLARYVVAVFDIVEAFVNFVAPVFRLYLLLCWLSALLVFMVVALMMQCSQDLLFIFSVIGLLLLSFPLYSCTIELFQESGLHFAPQVAIYIWTQCLIELTICIQALHRNQMKLVTATLMSSILTNSLFASSFSLLNNGNSEQQLSSSKHSRQACRRLLFGAVLAIIVITFIGVPREVDQKRSGLLLGAVAGLELVIYLLYILNAFTGHDRSLRDIVKSINSGEPFDRSYDSADIRFDAIPTFFILSANIFIYSIVFVNSHPTQIGSTIGLFLVPFFSWRTWIPILFHLDLQDREFYIFCTLNKSTLVVFFISPSLVLLSLWWHPQTLMCFSGVDSVVLLMSAVVLVGASKVTERTYIHCIAQLVFFGFLLYLLQLSSKT